MTELSKPERSDSRRGRLLDGQLAFFYTMPPPKAGYAVGDHGRLFRNGELVAHVEKVVFDRGAVAWWVYYKALPGSVLDRRLSEQRCHS